MQKDKSEQITITLPNDMWADINKKVQSGTYSSTSEVIHEAMRLWQQQDQEHQARLNHIRDRLERSSQSGKPVLLDEAFEKLKKLHQHRLSVMNNEKI